MRWANPPRARVRVRPSSTAPASSATPSPAPSPASRRLKQELRQQSQQLLEKPGVRRADAKLLAKSDVVVVLGGPTRTKRAFVTRLAYHFGGTCLSLKSLAEREVRRSVRHRQPLASRHALHSSRICLHRLCMCHPWCHLVSHPITHSCVNDPRRPPGY